LYCVDGATYGWVLEGVVERCGGLWKGRGGIGNWEGEVGTLTF
jgi:hypothetical protein